MRRRIVIPLVLLMGCVLIALSVPFGRSLAAGRQQEMFVDRLQDTNQFAVIAQQATTSVALKALRDDVIRYGDLYGITAAVIGRGGTTWAISGQMPMLDRPDVKELVQQAAAGHQSAGQPTIWPWSSNRPIIVAVPVVRGDNVIAVAVTISSAARLREGLSQDLILLVLADLAAMMLLVAGAVRLANWVLRPVFVLDTAARRISEGDLSTRVDAATGPVELRHLATTFDGMAQAVDLAMQRQEAFVADASHQLRNPLAGLVLRLDGLDEMGLDEARCDQLRFAREEANRLTDILDELTDLATAVHVTARPVLIDVTSLVYSRVAAWQPLAQHRRVRLTPAPGLLDRGVPGAVDPSVPGPVDCPPVWSLVDPLLLSSALDAVLDNAVKFTPSGGVATVHVAGDGDGVRVDVVDSGPGLSDDDLTHIGDRFWRSAASQNIAGSGLGLSIARALLGIAGAQLEFAAAAPHGLRATIRLPGADGGGL